MKKILGAFFFVFILSCSESDTNQVTASNIENIVYGNCRVASRESDVTDSNSAILEQMSEGTKITIQSAYHRCDANTDLSGRVLADTLILISNQADITSTCICKSSISFIYLDALPSSLAYVKFDGQYFVLKE